MNRTEAIEVIRKSWPVNRNGMLSDALETLIPELKESEDERIRKGLLKVFKPSQNGYWAGMKIKDIVAYLEKQREQKPAEWSEEDKVMLNNIIWGIHMKSIKPLDEMDDRSKYEKYEDFLKSLPERFNLQSKQEWSEEDETAFSDLMWCIEQAKKFAKDENDMGNIWFAENWLKKHIKFLRPCQPCEVDDNDKEMEERMIENYMEGRES